MLLIRLGGDKLSFSLFCTRVRARHVLDFCPIEETYRLKICWKHKAVRWRLLFLGLETAFEDAMISLVIMEYCISVCCIFPVYGCQFVYIAHVTLH